MPVLKVKGLPAHWRCAMMSREEKPMDVPPTSAAPPYQPLQSIRHWQRLLALPISIGALGCYVSTLAPSVVAMFDDSLELQLVAYQLAIAHPTGYPLYTLLGWLFTRIPMGDAAYRVNLMSAVFGAITVGLVYLTGLELNPTWAGPSRNQSHAEDRRQPWIKALAATIGAFSLVVSPVFWSQATVAEVYTLNAAFVAALLWMLLRTKGVVIGSPRPDSEKSLLALTFLFGLSLTHHRTILMLLPAIIFYLWRQLNTQTHSKVRAKSMPLLSGNVTRTAVKFAAALIMPLLVYLYIPLRGHIGSLDGAYTNTLGGFWQHIMGSGYSVFIFENPFGGERRPDFYVSMFFQQFGPLGLAAGLVGLMTLRRNQAGSLTFIAFATYSAFNLLYRVADIQVFFIPPFLIWALWIGAAASWLLTGPGLAGTGHIVRWQLPMSAVITLLLVGQSVVLLRNNLVSLDRSNDWTVYDYGVDVMQQPMEKGAAVVGILGEVTLVRYFQAVRGLRPDLLPIAADQETERLATVAHLLDQGRAVYLTRVLPGASERWSLSAVGPLIQVNPHPVFEAPGISSSIASLPVPEIALKNYTTTRPPTHANPPPLRLTLIWQAMAPMTRDLKISTRLITADGQMVAQADAVPVHFAYPTSAWRPGEFIRDVYDLTLPTSLPAGYYIPLIILYEPAPGTPEVGRLTLTPVYLP